ncbi:hypothetical protein MP228_006327 [Amoeboaphelidium protococcarum]|nr:hypothetical protein MP228_006327 [Amoeboaphelidium protococcarum]
MTVKLKPFIPVLNNVKPAVVRNTQQQLRRQRLMKDPLSETLSPAQGKRNTATANSGRAQQPNNHVQKPDGATSLNSNINSNPSQTSSASPIGKRPWYYSKWAIAGHVIVVYAGVSYYIQQVFGEKIKSSLQVDIAGRSSAGTLQSSQQTPLEQLNAVSTEENAASGTVFDKIASMYDSKIDMDELMMGIKAFRWWMIRQHARGDVLEVSCGTGRNLKYYHVNQVQSLRLLDQSSQMLEITQQKVDNYRNLSSIPTKVEQGDATRILCPDNTYDTVIDTFGLCSILTQSESGIKQDHSHDNHDEGRDVIDALNELARVCKPEGKVLLLEHGQSNYGFVEKALRDGAETHLTNWGCRWNRDIERLVRSSNLEIEYINRWNFGSTYYIVARPKKSDADTLMDSSTLSLPTQSL